MPESDSTTPGWSGGCFRRRRPSCTSRPRPGLERGPPGAAAQGRDALAATPWRGRRGSGSCRADPREPHSYWSRASGVSRAHRYEPDLLKAIEEERQAAGQLAVATQEVLGRLEARRPGGGGAGPRARRGPPVADRGPRCRRRVAPTAAGRGRPAVGHTRCRAGRYRRPDGRAGSKLMPAGRRSKARIHRRTRWRLIRTARTRKPALHGFRAVRPRESQVGHHRDPLTGDPLTAATDGRRAGLRRAGVGARRGRARRPPAQKESSPLADAPSAGLCVRLDTRVPVPGGSGPAGGLRARPPRGGSPGVRPRARGNCPIPAARGRGTSRRRRWKSPQVDRTPFIGTRTGSGSPSPHPALGRPPGPDPRAPGRTTADRDRGLRTVRPR